MSNLNEQLEKLRLEGEIIILQTGLPLNYRRKLLQEIEKRISELEYMKEQHEQNTEM